MPGLALSFTDHAIKRMFERGVDVPQVRQALEQGEVIEDYPDDFPFPSRLVMAWIGGKRLHVVAADNPDAGVTIVITLYEPDDDHWEPPDYRRRKE